MNKPTSVYIIFALALVVGLWLILSLGSAFLTAPPDFSGRWQLLPIREVSGNTVGGQPPDSSTDAAAEPTGMNLDQSGRFLRVTFDNGPRIDLVLAGSQVSAAVPPSLTMQWTGNPWSAVFSGPVGGSKFDFHFAGPRTYDFHGQH